MVARASNEKVASLQYLRGVAALMVVLFHAGALIGSDNYHGNQAIGSLTSGLNIGVDLFFVLSGFVISVPLFLGRTVPSPREFLVNRALRIYPLVALTALIFTASSTILSGKPFADNIDVLLSSALLVPYPKDPVPIVLWTLRQEMLFYLLFAVVLVSRRTGLIMIVGWATSSFLIGSSHWLWGIFFHPNNIQFAMGIGTCFVCSRISISSALASVAFALSGALLLVYALFWNEHTSVGMFNWGVGSAGILSSIVVGTAYFSSLLLGRSLLLLGKASFSIYLIHYFFISAVNKVLFGFRHFLPDVVSLVILFVLAVIGGVIFFLLFEKPLERVRKGLMLRPKLTCAGQTT
ncbi:acyltransferase family protein [Rubellimicrobium roseum]|uniref:Acyltransferase n=1 Tax=Rubellimicrobium roseum TaxID=687525 RepID=A0A5C4NC66_9RHOB|nr:acyltransferase [Rubellimicrobium roseum]TNC71475.1 acyltransferase [Rubellimicrobium roseum]